MQGIGQLLWKLREKEGIRQKQLCLGISSVSKYARIEADQQEIDFFLIDRIMGRLGKSVERLTYILPRDIYNIYELRQEIQQKICQKKWEEAKQCLLEYEKNKRAKEPLHQQFIEQEYAQIAWLRGKSVETVCEHLEKAIVQTMPETSVYKGYKQDKIEMRGDRAEMSDFPLYLNTVAGGLDRRDQTIGGFSFVVKIYAVPVVEIIG